MDASTPEDDAVGAANASMKSSDMAISVVLKDLETQFVSKSLANDSLQLQLQEERSKVLELNRKVMKQDIMEKQIATMEQEANITKNKLSSFIDESKLKQEILDKKQVEADNLREELRYVALYVNLFCGSKNFD